MHTVCSSNFQISPLKDLSTHKRLGRSRKAVKQNFSNNQFEIHIEVLNTSILSNCTDEPSKLQKKKKSQIWIQSSVAKSSMHMCKAYHFQFLSHQYTRSTPCCKEINDKGYISFSFYQFLDLLGRHLLLRSPKKEINKLKFII